jgi:predicted pyridoxine 5'-phosphate oxidase superfamily flavin-nucleotide-binding protein
VSVLTKSLLHLIAEQKFGYVATVGTDGAPNVSPKGTFIALDSETIAFGEIRSPSTIANIAHDPRVEVNMVDVFSRKGARFRGAARFVERGTAEFDALYPRWEEIWGPDFSALFNGFVVIRVTSVKPLTSPAYDVGAEEMALRAEWLAKFTKIQEDYLDG